MDGIKKGELSEESAKGREREITWEIRKSECENEILIKEIRKKIEGD